MLLLYYKVLFGRVFLAASALTLNKFIRNANARNDFTITVSKK
jgi:hypothetical protein